MLSKQHQTTYDTLKEMFPLMRINIEHPIEGRQFLDIYMPDLSLAFEVHGPQHFGVSTLFHKNKSDFETQIMLDKKKLAKCKELGIRVIYINYDENVTKELILRKMGIEDEAT